MITKFLQDYGKIFPMGLAFLSLTNLALFMTDEQVIEYGNLIYIISMLNAVSIMGLNQAIWPQIKNHSHADVQNTLITYAKIGCLISAFAWFLCYFYYSKSFVLLFIFILSTVSTYLKLYHWYNQRLDINYISDISLHIIFNIFLILNMGVNIEYLYLIASATGLIPLLITIHKRERIVSNTRTILFGVKNLLIYTLAPLIIIFFARIPFLISQKTLTPADSVEILICLTVMDGVVVFSNSTYLNKFSEYANSFDLKLYLSRKNLLVSFGIIIFGVLSLKIYLYALNIESKITMITLLLFGFAMMLQKLLHNYFQITNGSVAYLSSSVGSILLFSVLLNSISINSSQNLFTYFTLSIILASITSLFIKQVSS